MRLEYNLELRQTQKLLMTPQLRQAIKLLQLPVLELTEYLDNQYMENPMLELDDADEGEPPVEEHRQVEERLPDIDWDQYFQETSEPREPVNREPRAAFEQLFRGGGDTLQQRLLQQLNFLPLTPQQRRLGAYIVNNLDSSGYLQTTCQDIARKFNVTLDAVQGALTAVQGLEPAGVGARDLRECLLLQLKQRHHAPPLAREIISQHLPLVAKGRVPVLAERLGVSTAQVQTAIDFIRELDPRPGLRVGDGSDTAYIYPDVTVLDVAGEWIVMVNDSYSPRLRVNPFYHRLLQAAQTEETRKFLQDKFNAALWLLKAVEQRRTTLHRITEFIVAYQQDFFHRGVKHLRPLRLRDVADALEIHESTVSRAVNGKYVQTPRGMFELRYFFSVNLETRDGCGASSTGVKQQLQELVDQEDKTQPLTDLQLAEKLQQQGIKISRRTVAKYREELGIPSSTMRRRWN